VLSYILVRRALAAQITRIEDDNELSIALFLILHRVFVIRLCSIALVLRHIFVIRLCSAALLLRFVTIALSLSGCDVYK
jgi:hypothetical protein